LHKVYYYFFSPGTILQPSSGF